MTYWRSQADQRAAESAKKDMYSGLDEKTRIRISKLDLLPGHKILNFDEMGVIIRNKLWIGNAESAKKNILFPSNIKAVISLGSLYSQYTDLDNITYHRILIDDENCDIAQHFEPTITFIDTHIKDGGVLVHCQAGISRSTTICIAYLMKSVGLSFDAAFLVTKSARSVIAPNSGFIKQLLQYESEIN